MQGCASRTVVAPARRLLKLPTVLSRARSVRLGVHGMLLEDAVWMIRTIELWRQVFPDKLILAQAYSAEEWGHLFQELLVECDAAEMFTTDWELLNYFQELSWNVDNDGEDLWDEGLQLLSECLYMVPVQFFNWPDELWFDEVPVMYPVLDFVRELVDPWYRDQTKAEVEVDAGLLAARIDQLVGEDAPWGLLPSVKDFCLKQTDNPLLDNDRNIFLFDTYAYSWNELPQLKAHHSHAREAWEKIEQFNRWYVADKDAQEDEILRILLEVVHE